MLPLSHWLVILSSLITIGGSIAYIRDTIKGKTKPNRVSWSMWALAGLVGTIAALTAHANLWATVRIFLAGFLPLIIFIASFLNRNSYWKLTFFDFACGLCSIVALIVLVFSSSPRISILLAVLGDSFATLPALRKVWISPETETAITYVASFVAVLLILPSIPVWNIENSAFQIYLLIANTLLLFSVYRKHLGFNKQPSIPTDK